MEKRDPKSKIFDSPKSTQSLRRKKPRFMRTDSHKMIKLGKGIKKKQKWRRPIGIQNKIRLSRKGHTVKVKIGWGSDKKIREKIDGLDVVRIENVSDVEKVGKGQGVLISNVGKKKREEILKKVKEKGLKVLNKYKVKSVEVKDATR